MKINIEALQLYRYPALNAFLTATSVGISLAEQNLDLLDGPGSTGDDDGFSVTTYKDPFDELLKSKPFPYYPYSLRLHVTKASISVYEICAALGKIDHLRVLLERRFESPCLIPVASDSLDGPQRLENALFFHDLMSEAVVNGQLAMIDFLNPHYVSYKLAAARYCKESNNLSLLDEAKVAREIIDNSDALLALKDEQRLKIDRDISKLSRLIKLEERAKILVDNGKQHLCRLAIDTGDLAVVDKVIEVTGNRISRHDLANYFLALALESGHLDIVNRCLEFETVRCGLAKDIDKLLVAAVRSRSLLIFNRFIELVDIKKYLCDRGLDLLDVAISCSEIFERILLFKEIKEAMDVQTHPLLKNALQQGNIATIDRLLNFKGVKYELKSYMEEYLEIAITNRRTDIFSKLYKLARYRAVMHIAPKGDLLCIAALKNNIVAMDTLLTNKSALALASARDFYRGIEGVGERLFIRAQALGIVRKLEIPELTSSPFTEVGVSSSASGSAVVATGASAGQKRGRFFDSVATANEPEDALVPEERKNGSRKRP